MFSSGRASGLLVIATNFDAQGGLQKRLEQVIERVAKFGRVTVITWGTSQSEDRRLPSGARVVRVPTLFSWGRDHLWPIAIANTAYTVVTGVFMALLTAGQWSSAYGSGLNPEGVIAAIAARPLGRVHVADTWLPGVLGNVNRFSRSPFFSMLRRLLSRAKILAETAEICEELLASGFPESRVTPIEWGVDQRHHRPASAAEKAQARAALGIPIDSLVAAYWGRMDLRQKRVDLLLEAWARIEVPHAHLIIAGSGPDEHKVKLLAQKLKAGSVTFLGWMNDITPVAHAADIFVLASEFEATGMAMIEGLARGLPGVVSATRGYQRMQPKGAVLVENDVEAWSSTIKDLLTHPEKRRELSAAAVGWLDGRYSLDQTVEEFSELLRF